MPKQISWQEKITWYFYRDEQLFDYTESDFERDACELQKIGIRIVLLGNRVHLRWDYVPYWPQILTMLKKLIRAFHKYNIRVVEHHSSSLTHKPISEERWECEKEAIVGGSGDSHWSLIESYLKSDDLFSVRYSSMLQIDGSTGKLAISPYDTYTFCYNNDDFRRIYFEYLEQIYSLGVDGIMTDDIQYYNGGNSCTCPTCRRMFREQYGYDLPSSPQEWKEHFGGQYENPQFMAFDIFRRQSAERFQRDVQAHFTGLGLKLLRPNYIAEEVVSNTTAYPFDNCADLWDVMFQENCYSAIEKYSWPAFACEATHRYAFASRNDIPSMSMFYDINPENFYFSWACAISWGQLYNSEFIRSTEMVQSEKKFRSFEDRYPQQVYDQKKVCDYAIYFSTKTRDRTENAIENSMNDVVNWEQSGLFSQKLFDFVLEEDAVEKLRKYSVIVLPHVFMLSCTELKKLRNYVAEGGKLVAAGEFGIRDADGTKRTLEEAAQLLGVTMGVQKLVNPVQESICFHGEKINELPFDLIYKGLPVRSQTTAGIVIAEQTIGLGSIIFIGAKTNSLPNHQAVWASRTEEQEKTISKSVPAPVNAVNRLRDTIGRILDQLIQNPIATTDAPDLQISVFDSSDANHRIMHLLNYAHTLCDDEGKLISHLDEFENFNFRNMTRKRNQSIHIQLHCPFAPVSVKLLSPELENEYPLAFKWEQGVIKTQIPPDVFSGYAMIDARKKLH